MTSSGSPTARRSCSRTGPACPCGSRPWPLATAARSSSDSSMCPSVPRTRRRSSSSSPCDGGTAVTEVRFLRCKVPVMPPSQLRTAPAARPRSTMTDRRAALAAGVALLLMAVLAPFTILGVIDPRRRGGGARRAAPPSGSPWPASWSSRSWTWSSPRRSGGSSSRSTAASPRSPAVPGRRTAWSTSSPSASSPRAMPRTSRGTRRSGTSGSCSSACTWCSSACSAGARASSRAWSACLVAVAGAAYAVDSVGVLLSESYDADLAAYLFVGEVVLMLWLLWWGLSASRGADGRSTLIPAVRAKYRVRCSTLGGRGSTPWGPAGRARSGTPWLAPWWASGREPSADRRVRPGAAGRPACSPRGVSPLRW